jgi:hypothetical protein
MPGHAVIAVTPCPAAAARTQLFRALEEAFQVRFEQREPPAASAGVDAVLAFAPLTEAVSPGVPTMVVGGAPLTGAPSHITFAASPYVDRRLRGRTLSESTKQPRRLWPVSDAEVLATRGSAPVWARRSDSSGGTTYLAASPPEELERNEPLKNRLRAGHFEGLLPIVHFLRMVSAQYAWNPAPLRAMVIFDDPNLRWPTYGHIDYRRLLEHARRYSYHVAMAMIPIDAALVHPIAARLYREHPDRLSLLMHGLKHERLELMQPLPPAARERAVARALRSIEGFERRSGLNVSRVMVAPYGEASEPYLATLLKFGIEALFANLPFPWLAGQQPRGPALTYWHPVNFVAGGLPVVPRYPFTYDLDELVLGAFLDHPLVLYGHHEDVADGLQTLQHATSLVNSLGKVQWTSASAIARQNVLTRCEDETFFVRLLARRVDVRSPEHVKTMEIDLSLLDGDLGDHEVVVASPTDAATMPAARVVSVDVPAERLTIEVRLRRRLDHHSIPAARLTPWPVLRRAMTETRDRLRPLLR